MNPLGEWIKRLIPAKILNILTLITNALLAGRNATGAYDVQDGPTAAGTGNFKAPQAFMNGPKGALVKSQVIGVLNDIGAPEHVEQGPSHWQAALFTTLSTILISAAQGLDWSKLFSNPREFMTTAFTAIIVAWGVYLSTPGQSKVVLGTNAEVKKLVDGSK